MRLRVVVVMLTLLFATPLRGDEAERAWFAAARRGDVVSIRELHQAGVDVNTSTAYGATALAYACDRGHLDVVRYLVENGADVNGKDEFYELTPLFWALSKNHWDVAVYLLDRGATGADQALRVGVTGRIEELVSAALRSPRLDPVLVGQLLEETRGTEGAGAIVAQLDTAWERLEAQARERSAVALDPSLLETYAGTYRNTERNETIVARIEDGRVVIDPSSGAPIPLRPLSDSRFQGVETPEVMVSFGGRAGLVERLVIEEGSSTTLYSRVVIPAAPVASERALTSTPAAAREVPRKVERVAAASWPSFRGPGAAGIADGQGAPVEWDLSKKEQVRWKTRIPGLGHSSPVIWGDRVYVTTAASSVGDDRLRLGLYGDVDSVDDLSDHLFMVYALDARTGETLWGKAVARAVPGTLRHMKSTQANSTPATDGKHVVALFGSIGLLVCYDPDGNLLWNTYIGVMDAGWFYDKSYQWGHASSPIIHDGKVYVQADIQSGSFIAAYKLSDGNRVWKTPRQDVPSWGTPTIYTGGERDELILNGTSIQAYDPATGHVLWRLTPNSQLAVPTPVVAHDLVFVTAGYPPVRPIYAIRPGGSGDISLEEGKTDGPAIAWSKGRGGTYVPTPIVYGDYLYACANNGRLTCYRARTGERIYQERIGGGGGSFTASPIAADGRLYFTEESGEIYVIKAGPRYEELYVNSMDEPCMATPAISDGLMVVRTIRHLVGIEGSGSGAQASAEVR